MFPIDLEIDEITVTISKHSDNYTPGKKLVLPKIANPYARGSQVRIM